MRERCLLVLLLACGDEPDGPPLQRAPDTTQARRITNATVVGNLRRVIEDRYAYRDRLGLDWNKVFAAAAPDLLSAPDREQLMYRLAAMLAPAQDPHLDVVTAEGRTFHSDPRKPERNIGSSYLNKALDWQHGRCISSAHVGAYAYVVIDGLERGRCNFLTSDWKNRYATKLSLAPAIILDLRGTAEGSEPYAREIAGYFVDAPTPYVENEIRDPTLPSGFRSPEVRVIQPHGGGRYAKPVVVLTGPSVMSSGESFVLMMRAAGAILVGARTRGAASWPWPEDLEIGDHIHVSVPTSRELLLDGSRLEGIGIRPDLEVVVTALELQLDDKIIDAAVAELDKRVRSSAR